MGEIDKMKRYIAQTKINIKNPLKYAMSVDEAFELAEQALICCDFSVRMISLAFDYGQAKGYRAAKAEGRAKA